MWTPGPWVNNSSKQQTIRWFKTMTMKEVRNFYTGEFVSLISAILFKTWWRSWLLPQKCNSWTFSYHKKRSVYIYLFKHILYFIYDYWIYIYNYIYTYKLWLYIYIHIFFLFIQLLFLGEWAQVKTCMKNLRWWPCSTCVALDLSWGCHFRGTCVVSFNGRTCGDSPVV